MPLKQVIEILYTIVGDMDSVMQATKPNQDKEVVHAYNSMLIIAKGLEKIEELLFDVFSPVVFNADMPDEYRVESLEDSFGAIIKEMTQMKNLLSLKNPIQRMESESLLADANEELENEKMNADKETIIREGKNIKSQQNVQNAQAYYGNKFNEKVAPISTIGKKLMEMPVNVSQVLHQ